jgi:hypothetical protein
MLSNTLIKVSHNVLNKFRLTGKQKKLCGPGSSGTIRESNEDIEMESLKNTKNDVNKWKLFGSAIDNTREQGQDTIHSWHRITSKSRQETEK